MGEQEIKELFRNEDGDLLVNNSLGHQVKLFMNNQQQLADFIFANVRANQFDADFGSSSKAYREL